MQEIDLKKQLKHLYGPFTREVTQAVAPGFQFLMADSEGEPNTSQAYAQVAEALMKGPQSRGCTHSSKPDPVSRASTMKSTSATYDARRPPGGRPSSANP